MRTYRAAGQPTIFGFIDRMTNIQTDRQTERLFSLVVKTKVVQNVNRMSKSQSDRQEDIQCTSQPDIVT